MTTDDFGGSAAPAFDWLAPVEPEPSETVAPAFAEDRRGFNRLAHELRACLKERSAGAPVRAWVPNCGAGADAYATAACVLEALGTGPRAASLRVFGTDTDGAAIRAARSGTLERVPPAFGRKLERRYFGRERARHRGRDPLRLACVFAEHAIGRDIPFSRVDVVVCGPRLIVGGTLERAAGEHVAFALKPGGLLWVGRAARGPVEFFEPVLGCPGLYRRRAGSPAPNLVVRAVPARVRLGSTAQPVLDGAQVVAEQRFDELRRQLADAQERFSSLVEWNSTARDFMRAANKKMSSSNGALRTLANRLRRAKDTAEGANSRLRVSETKYRRLFSTASDAILILDAREERIIDANAAAFRLYHRSRPALLKLKAGELVAERPEGSPHAYHRRPDGTRFPVEESSWAFSLGGREMSMRLVRDVTARLRAEAAQAYRQREAMQDAFLATISHELRTPVAAIKGFVETLERGVREPNKRRSFIQAMGRNAERLARLVEGVLTLSGLQSGRAECRPSPVRLRELLEDALAGQRSAAARRRIRLRLAVPESLTVLVDPTQVPHVFENLLHNAVKYNKRGGHVTVTGKAVAGEVLISVRDDGPGIPEQDLDKVFERFYRCERSQGVPGSGLGLSIVRDIVLAHRGRIWAVSAPGRGACFHVALPRD